MPGRGDVMIKTLLDSAVIVALITVAGVIFSSLIAPLILKYFETAPDEETPGEEAQ